MCVEYHREGAQALQVRALGTPGDSAQSPSQECIQVLSGDSAQIPLDEAFLASWDECVQALLVEHVQVPLSLGD